MGLLKTLIFFVEDRLLGNKRTTLVGTVFVATTAAGRHLESIQGLELYGKIICSLSDLFCSLFLLMSKDRK